MNELTDSFSCLIGLSSTLTGRNEQVESTDPMNELSWTATDISVTILPVALEWVLFYLMI